MARGTKLKGRTYEDIYGYEKAQELRAQRKTIKHCVSELTREKLRKARKRFLAEHPEEAYHNSSKTFLNKTYEDIYGVGKAKTQRKKIREALLQTFRSPKGKEIVKDRAKKVRNWWNTLSVEDMNKFVRKDGYECSRYGRRPDMNEQYFRSSWEANIARVLNLLEIDWKYEPRVFKIALNGETHFYRPDLYLPTFKYWIEIKGWGSLEKFEAFKIQHSNETIFLLDETKYGEIEQIFQPLIRFWETGKSVETKRLTPDDAGEVIVRPAW